jgi:hypothetical protein
LVVVALLIIATFAIGVSIGSSANADPSPSGTSIPITKGGTGATDKTNALKNLLPDLAGNDGKVLGLNGGTPTWVDFPQRNDSITATSATYSFKGTRYVELGYSGNWSGQYKKFYHGEGIPAGSNNFVALKVKAASWGGAQYAEFLVRVDLNQNTSFHAFTVTPLVNTGTSAITIPEFTLSGNATAFDIWLKGDGYGYIAELLTYDEVSANDTLLNETPVATAPTPATGLTTKTSGSWVGDNYSISEVNTGGTWTDGKPIYRKVVNVTINYATTAFGQTNLGLTGIDTLVNVGGQMSWNAAFYSLNAYEGNKIPYASAMSLLADRSGNNAFLWVNSSKTLYFDAKSTSAGGQVVLNLIVEYTKV